MPGPIPIAEQNVSLAQSIWVWSMKRASGTAVCSTSRLSGQEAMLSTPHPLFRAARPARTAAPAMPGFPVVLNSRAWPGIAPPVARMPGAWGWLMEFSGQRKAFLANWNERQRLFSTTGFSLGVGLSAISPEGISIEYFVPQQVLMNSTTAAVASSNRPSNPVPTKASIKMSSFRISGSPSWPKIRDGTFFSCISCAFRPASGLNRPSFLSGIQTSTGQPRSFSIRASAKPSPPLLPRPQKMTNLGHRLACLFPGHSAPAIPFPSAIDCGQDSSAVSADWGGSASPADSAGLANGFCPEAGSKASGSFSARKSKQARAARSISCQELMPCLRIVSASAFRIISTG